jgi:hypothetical protein
MAGSSGIKTSKYWFARAEECRALAETFQHKATREKMFKVAEGYQRMGLQSAERELAATVSGTAKVGAD